MAIVVAVVAAVVTAVAAVVVAAVAAVASVDIAVRTRFLSPVPYSSAIKPLRLQTAQV